MQQTRGVSPPNDLRAAPRDPRARPVLTGIAPDSAEWAPQWVGFGDEPGPPPARFIGFGDEDLRPVPPLPERAETGISAQLPGIALRPVPGELPAAARLAAPARPVYARRRPAAAAARPPRQIFLPILCLLLLAYALGGKAAAYVGLRLGEENGIFVSELVLFLGLATLMVRSGYEQFFSTPVAMPWCFFFLWNAAQTFPYLPQYGLVALRDGAEWGYSLYAVVVCGVLLTRRDGFALLFTNFQRFARWFVYGIPIIVGLTVYRDWLDPNGLLADFIGVRFGDALVNLAGVMAFAVTGLVAVRAWWWWVLGIDFVLLASHNRGGLIAFIAACGAVLIANFGDIRGTLRHFAGFGAALALMLLLSFAVDLRINAYVNDRAISPQQLVTNFVASFEDTGNLELDGTREWRLEWWNKIINYTVYGPYFWTGKGYGINLADADGFGDYTYGDPYDNPAPLRSPHNSHLTFLGRAGVPGFILWVLLQLSWVMTVGRALLFARRTRRGTTAALLTFFAAFWVADMLEAATDVTLEAPFAAIWYWTMFGAALAVAVMVRRDPDFFERAPFAGARGSTRRQARPRGRSWVPVPAAARLDERGA